MLAVSTHIWPLDRMSPGKMPQVVAQIRFLFRPCTVHPHARGEQTSCSPFASACGGSVHPHTCGERKRVQLWRQDQLGSSPRPWGTGLRLDASCATDPVHPHARGEQDPCTEACGSPSGSSPRPWGTGPPPLLVFVLPRFIPTPVGNSEKQTTTSSFVAVHPHARGEQDRVSRLLDLFAGSSPRLRGTAGCPAKMGFLQRFIPAPAGNGYAPPLAFG